MGTFEWYNTVRQAALRGDGVCAIVRGEKPGDDFHGFMEGAALSGIAAAAAILKPATR